MCLLDLQIIAIAFLVATACVLPGTFLVLRGIALMSDAISHAILPGMVIMFLITKNVHSPLLMVGAGLAGILTVLLTESIIASKRLQKDAAIGLVFPLFFSVGIVLISLYARSVHLDVDMVIMGELLFAPLNTVYLWGCNLGPAAFWIMGTILLLNALFISFCYKELILTTFNPTYATTIGLGTAATHYGLMCLTSITCVGAFEIVGAIVVVSLIITPPATAYLLSKRVDTMLYRAIIIALLSVCMGYACAMQYDVSVAGAIATANGLCFFSALMISIARHYRAKKWHVKRLNKQHAL